MNFGNIFPSLLTCWVHPRYFSATFGAEALFGSTFRSAKHPGKESSKDAKTLLPKTTAKFREVTDEVGAHVSGIAALCACSAAVKRKKKKIKEKQKTMQKKQYSIQSSYIPTPSRTPQNDNKKRKARIWKIRTIITIAKCDCTCFYGMPVNSVAKVKTPKLKAIAVQAFEWPLRIT